MARKDDTDFDEFGLDDFNFDDDGDFSMDPPKDDRKPVTKVATSFIEGVEQTAKDPAFAKRLIKGALPEGYGKALEAVDDTAGSARELYNSAAAELKPAMLELKRVSRSILPKVRGSLPDKLTKRLDKFLADEESKNDKLKEETQETQLTLELGQIFKDRQEAEVDREARQTTEARLRDGVRSQQHESTINQIDTIRRGMDRLVGYQDSITIQYQRKSLELQYRQFFVMRDTLVHHKESFAETLSNLQAISKNTGLPEYVKINNSEFAAQAIKEKLYGGLADSFSDYSRSFKTKLFTNIKDKVMGNVQRFAEGINAGAGMLEQVEMMHEMQQQMGGGMSAGQMAGNMFGSTMAGNAGNWIGSKVKKQLGKNDRVNQFSDKLMHFLGNVPAAMNDFAKGNALEDGLFGGLIRAGKELIPTYSMNTAVASKDKERAHEAVPFSLLTRKSIVEIIPGYLSRILQELQITRTGDLTTDRLVFNHDRDQFTTAKVAAKDMSSSIFDEATISSTNNQVDGVAGLLLRNTNISKSAKEKFKHLLLTDAAKGIHFSAERYSDPNNLGEELKPLERIRIAGIIRTTFGIDKNGKFSSAKGTALQTKVGRHFASLRDGMTSHRESAIDYAELGNRELLRDQGLFVKDGVDDRLDYDKVWDVYRNGRIEEGNGENGQGKGSWKASHNRRRPSTPNNVNGVSGSSPAPAWNTSKNESSNLESVIRETNALLIESIQSGNTIEEARHTAGGMDHIIAILESGSLGGGGGAMPTGGRFTRMRKGLTGAIGRGAKGLWDSAGKLYSGAFSGVGSLLKGAGSFGGGLLTRAGSWLKTGVGDVYVNGESTPALLASKMRQGDYYLMRGKKRVVVRKFSDLFGKGKPSPVYDSSDNDNVALSLEQIRKGLHDSRGAGLVTKGLNLIGNMYSGMLSPVTAGIGLVVNTAKSIAKWVTKQRDIYVKGETTPRILASVLEAGGYFSEKTNEVVTSIKDFDGNIVDKDGNIVLSLNDMRKGLVDRFGGKFESMPEKLLTGAMKIAKLPFTMISKGIAFGKDIMKGGADFMGSILASLTGGTTKNSDLLEQIRNILDERLPSNKRKASDGDGDGDRDGSWQDQFSRRGRKRNSKGKRKGRNGRGVGSKAAAAAAAAEDEFGVGDALDAYESAKDAGGLLKKAGSYVKNSRLGGLAARGLAAAGTTLMGSAAMGSIVNGAIAAGGALATGAGALATGAAGLATATLSLLSAPVVLGIGAVAAVGIGAYYGYKYFTRKDMPLARVRFAQYGVDVDDEEEAAKVLQLEDKLLPALKYTKGSSAQIGAISVKLEDILKEFGVDPTDEDEVKVWITWFAKRFKPVFQLHAGVLNDIAPQVKLAEADDKLSKSLKLAYLDKVKFDTNDKECPYNFEEGAFGDADTDAEDVADAFSDAYDKVKAMPDDAPVEPAPDSTAKTTAASAAASIALAGKAATTGGLFKGLDLSPSSLISTVGKVVSPLLGAVGLAITAGEIIGSFFSDSRLDALTCVRLKAYGLTSLESDKVKALMALEAAVAERIAYDSKGKAKFKEGAEVYLKSMGASFGIVSSNSDDVIAWTTWFTGRFIPVLLTFCTVLRMIAPATKPREAGKVLKADQILDTAKAIISCKSDTKDGLVSIWLVGGSPFPGYEVNSDVKSTDGNIEAIKSNVKETEYKDVDGKSLSSKAYGPPVGVMKPGATGPVDFRDTPSPLLSNRNTPVGGGTVLGGLATGTYSAADMIKGRGIVQPGNGTGGDINQIPMPKGDGSWAAVKDTILAAANMAGVDSGLMATMASIESGFRSSVKAGTSSATGLYQFISGTWKDMLRKYGPKYGINPNTPPSDARANALMGAEFLKENSEVLAKGLGRQPTDTDLYLAHFMGAGGAVNLLKGDPNAIAASISPKAAAANKSIFYEGVRARTLAEVYAEIDRRVKGHSNVGGGSGPVSTTPPAVAGTAATTAPVASAAPATPAATGPIPIGIAAKVPATASVAPANIAQAPLMMKVADTGSAVMDERKQLAERAATVTDVQSKSLNEAMNGSMGQMLDVLSKSLQTQQSMDSSLKEISRSLSGGMPNTAAPVSQQVASSDKPVIGKRPSTVAAKQAPISMSQAG